MYNLVIVFTDENTTVEELLEPFGINKKVENKNVWISKDELIIQEKFKMMELESNCRNKLNIPNLPEDSRKIIIDIINKLEKLLYKSTSEELYDYVIQFYPKELITPKGGIYYPHNPYAKWVSYSRDGRHTNYLPIENPEKKGEIIYVNSAKLKDIKWDFIKYGTVPSEAFIMPDGTWYDEHIGTCVKVHRDKEKKITLEDGVVGKTIIENNQEWTVNIVEYYI